MPMKDEVWQTRSACGWGEVAHGKQVTIFGHLWLQWFKKRYVVEVRMQELAEWRNAGEIQIHVLRQEK